MNPFEALASALNRIAAATSVLRTREQDAERLDVHGGTVAEVAERVQAAASQLENAAARLEKAIV
jgi:sRNA-binding protein